LTLEKVLVDRDATKLLVCFLSDRLVEEKEYLRVRNALQRRFAGMRVSLRVCSPALAEEARRDLAQFTPFLTDCLARSFPGIRPWLTDAAWSLTEDRVRVSVSSEAALQYVRHVELDKRLTALMFDVFRLNVETVLLCEEDVKAQRERLASLQEKAEEAVAAAQVSQAEAYTQSPQKRERRIFGKAIKDAPTPVGALREDSGRVTIQGEVVGAEAKELKGGEMRLISFGLTDYTATIGCKLFLRCRGRKFTGDGEGGPPAQEELSRVEGVAERIKAGQWLKVRGDCQYDKFAREPVVMITDIEEAEAPKREDTAERKRVELHLHTQMSAMDAVSSAESLIAQAAAFGHPAVAVTDHGVVQAFPDAFAAAGKHKIKLIPGLEGYLVDEAMIYTGDVDWPIDTQLVVLDFETTGLTARSDRIIEIGAVRVRGGAVEDEMSLFIDPGIPVPAKITRITGIDSGMLAGAPRFADAARGLLDFIGDAPVAAHNAAFDIAFLKAELQRLGRSWDGPVVDTLAFARQALPSLSRHKLETVCRHLGVSLENAHRAVHDARATAQALIKLLQIARQKDAQTLAALNHAFTTGAMGDTYHVVLLAMSQTGVTNLNRLVSEGHLNYFQKRPRIPRTLLQKWREGLIVGSACEAGELFQAILSGRDEKTLSQTARFYDYLEIQPAANNEFLIREGRLKDVEELRDINRKIVALGERNGLPVVATGDVHFLKPEDAKFRAILMAGLEFSDPDLQPPLYFKTTDEMLEEFAYLGAEKAMEVVVDAPNRIAEKVGDVRLFPPHPEGKETFQPFLEGAAEAIQDMCWREAHRLYGETLPGLVEDRIHKELGSIIGYGFATLYSIGERLVKKSLSDGYLVGSRGSIGSSFVATLCGITEVNPLPPHYLCPQCRHVEWDDTAATGVDLPAKACPVCGAALSREGFDIPFEVFLGFYGDKVPDIDLNFSGVYQPRAHKYVEELFGASNVFRAGTIGTLAEKTAYGFVNKYLEERGQQVTEAEKNRLVQGCVGVKRTTGQHPGGIVVLPKDYEIYQFTAIQHPADVKNSPIITTHYDFGSMHDVLVKLDILGHDDPTMIKMLERLTGVSARGIPLNDPAVMSLFVSPAALTVEARDIRCNTGTLGIPEFGTRFVRGMLEATRPATVEELIRISGLSHGTDVWLGNAETLIGGGIATLKECVCTRDDIMNYLMQRGVEPKMAFQTMESVRRGKGLTAEMEAAMRAADTPDWFIDSCKKIKYLFPRGHAVAYVAMALRIAWYKVNHPKAYYAAYYTVRADAFDIGVMRQGPDELRGMLDNFDSRWKELTAAEREQVQLLEIALEMAVRGVRLLPVDLYASDAEEFQVLDEGILPPFTSIPGLGLAAAQALCGAREAGPYMSVEDVKLRARVSGTVIEQMRTLGALKGLAETSQVSFL
ncbi:MAG: PolC-type DNA polymerase III, partial [Firmicutes bacterium]|nr:PolC-type DNA polymerase III [Bacillota bacterium]